jgi:hypothetical protein
MNRSIGNCQVSNLSPRYPSCCSTRMPPFEGWVGMPSKRWCEKPSSDDIPVEELYLPSGWATPSLWQSSEYMPTLLQTVSHPCDKEEDSQTDKDDTRVAEQKTCDNRM